MGSENLPFFYFVRAAGRSAAGAAEFLAGYGIDRKTALKALASAEKAQSEYEEAIRKADEEILADARSKGLLTVLLIGRPYHTDPLIQHKVAEIVADMGVNVISDDIVRGRDIPLEDVHFVSQWAYTNRILKAAKWGAVQTGDVQCIQLTSFGCGPDAFLTDAVRLLRESYLLHAGLGEISCLWGEEAKFCRNFAPFIGNQNIESLVAEAESAMAQIRQNGNPTIVFTHFALSVSKMIKKL